MINFLDSLIGFFIVWTPLWAILSLFDLILLIYIIILLKRLGDSFELE